MHKFEIAVLGGDGIGAEVMPLCCEMLDQVASDYRSFAFNFHHLDAGAACYRRTGESLPAETLDQSRAADAVLLGAMGLPDVRYPDGTEIAPQLELRFDMNLYAGLRPVKPIANLPLPLANRGGREIDFMLIRESTEGLFASHGKGIVVDDEYATDTMKISRTVSEKLFDFGFRLAGQRKQAGHAGRLTCVDKANVFASMAFFRKIYDEIGGAYPGIEQEHMYVDAAALNMVRQPWNLDVLVTENMFGDILSDLGAGLMGGMGMAPSADIGDHNAVFQPCHGSAPDIAGRGMANPTAMLLSGAMMLSWLGDKHGNPELLDGASRINRAVNQAYAKPGLVPLELGGSANTADIFTAAMEELAIGYNRPMQSTIEPR